MKKSKAGGSKHRKAAPNKSPDACLLVLDFDHTVVDKNTDTFVWKLGENGKIPDSISSAHGEKLWTHLMQDVFDYLHQQGCTPKQILDCLASMKLAPGMDTLLYNVPENYDIIIISDSNAVFIQHILETHGVFDRIAHIFTNPANFDEDGRLVVTPFTEQTACDICEKNLCKGDALKMHVDRMAGTGRKKYGRVVYVGDGLNDLCPCFKLGKNDAIFPRSGFRLEEEIKKIQRKKKEEIQAEVVAWQDASTILEYL
ncbi:pyridoxal phosphate phosphatase PHOSPHO2-like [Pollicipes pollicipes]|uniref:pyridoxal phosphate phosphatase PHOSPHO2-like n=1 Tax=Pollicipes pollicipes TaxID=41117 RepID=UPI001885731F|nr:pyridoxal phosphate phosphatase PHOSPHO2-like [Pollicipes pollicipes]XP_037075856.1 pyridoxal phosphate phosphatase PHOSPHO2-like [Pollicipes pollicipes]